MGSHRDGALEKREVKETAGFTPRSPEPYSRECLSNFFEFHDVRTLKRTYFAISQVDEAIYYVFLRICGQLL